jgi:hypothetical protein
MYKFDTGGYTGDWGSKEGRMALLHQKELVLNESDTENFLDALGILRNINLSYLDTLNEISGVRAPSIKSVTTDSGVVEQKVQIDATFPNVKDHKEVEQALNNLVNVAAQRAMQNKRV